MTGEIPHFNVRSAPWDALPEFGGREAVLYRSPDGRRVAATFQESGVHRFEYPFDEMLYVVAGRITITPEGAEPVTLGPGDMAYLQQGTKVTLDMSDDFHDVTVLISDQAIAWR